METRHKILVLDDDPVFLELYKEWLEQLPSKPEITTCTSGARAMALLEAEPYRVLICDLKMPQMDGLQVLSIVRRRFPELRTVVMTGVADEEFRSRAYALGVDLFWLKPDTQQNMQMFLECLESLLGRDAESGFRGIQNKSLMDILQMECLSQSSTVFRITRGSNVGKIWILNGDLIDAETEGARGEAAFRRILEWKSGTFETLPSEPEHERTIMKSVNALLLETAQAMDEDSSAASAPVEGESPDDAAHRQTVWRIAALAREGAEWVVSLPNEPIGAPEGWGTQSAAEYSAWMRYASEATRRLGEKLEAGPWSHIQMQNHERRAVLLPSKHRTFLVAWAPGTDSSEVLEKTKKLVTSWDS
ncbi:MAG TPA: response regulator, partial [Candidatus Polarisedimenticolia bacterium]|nr:response regulator [Candidatus Polarisedimenticolia bacterium]